MIGRARTAEIESSQTFHLLSVVTSSLDMAEVYPGSMASPALTSIEVCAGAGGQAIGLHRAGFKHLALLEIDTNAAETLRQNGTRSGWWKPSIVYERTLVGWEPPVVPGGVDLVAGGVPCPPFSVAGKQLGWDDERDLFPALLDLVDLVRPRALMVENVRGLLGRKFLPYRAQILDRLSDMGYVGEWELLEAQDFGVPQLRPRSVLVAATQDVWNNYKWPTPGLAVTPTVGEALLSMMSSGGWSGAVEWSERADTIAPTVVGGSKKHGGADLGPSRAKAQWSERLGVNGKVLADAPPAIDYVGEPKLTVEMAAIIQGFPEDWIISGKKTARYRQIGNAFPPPVSEAVGRQIRSAITLTDG